MGLLECPPGHSRLVATPHPVTDEGQNELVAQLLPGETLGAFLRRTVPDWHGDAWEVRINGVLVPVEVMERVRPKDRTLIEARGLVKKTALYIVAMIALTYFTFGLGSATAGAWGAGAAATAFGGGVAGALFASVVFVAGSVLINKVLGPKPISASQADQNTVYTIGAGRNQARPYQPLGLPFGRVKYAPDILSLPYTWFEGDDQYVGMVLTPGVNVQRVEELYLGDALLSSFEGVQVYYAGFPGMPEQTIPLYTDADTINGGELNKDRTYVQRTTPPRTVRILVNLGYVLGDADSKGRPYTNIETVEVQYCPVGTGAWAPLVSRNFANSDYNPHRATLARDVPEGQYDVRVRILGRAVDGGGSNGQSKWQWETMVAVQADPADYAGIPRIGIRMKASGQLQNAPDEIRCVCVSRPVPVWTGTEWVVQETSNPGAHILAYARGINDENGNRIAGIGLPEEMIDVPGLQAFMLHCAAEGFGYDYVVKDPRNHDDMVNSLALAGFGQVSWASGRLSPVWAADEQPLSGVVGMGTIKRGQFQVDYTLASASDGIEYTYYDAQDWSTRTLRIPAPGVTTMLNPTQVTGEGITSEAHAAMLARWHLAQSLYQYKDISYATDLEHLSYRRMSMLSLSHDLTQWGISGRVVAARIEGGVVSIDLGEPVRAPDSGKAYLGLRIPGERTYRVFEVRPFQGESAHLQLVGAWPSDAALPGNTSANPAADTLWCYDFKATPGYRVRVVKLEPESGLTGARVSVVPEGPEFWEYVRTGRYIRPPNQSLLQTRPVASDLQVSERQVVQGDTVFTELVAQWEVSGPVGDTVVQMADPNGQLQEVARTTTRSAAWRIPGAGTYQVAVRPFAPDGRPGIATGTIYSTIGADAPPVLIDLFDVEERSGGVRLYTWGWFDGTTRSADFAGVEIRVTAGKVAAPDWNAMEPVGNADGYHTAPFEAVVPASGDWTFAARSRNTSGTLSIGMRVVAKTLGRNLGEQIGGIGDDLGAIGDDLAKEISDRFEADAKVASDAAADAAAKATAARQAAVSAAASDATTKANNARTAAIATAAADATAKANAARDDAIARADAAMAQAEALAAEIAEIVGAPEWEAGETYNAGWLVRYDGGLYRARVQTTGQNPETTPAAWEKLGDYDSVGEALAAALAATTQLATDLSAEVTRLDAVVARLPSGNGALAAQATVAANAAASVQRDEALASRQTAAEAKMPIDGGRAASEARANAIEQAAATATAANASRLATLEARTPAGTGKFATAADVLAEQAARTAADEANARALEQVSASLQGDAVSLVANGNFADGLTSWAASANPNDAVFDAAEGALYSAGATRLANTVAIPIVPGKSMRIEVTYRTNDAYAGWNSGGVGLIGSLSNPTGWVGSMRLNASQLTKSLEYRTAGTTVRAPADAGTTAFIRVANAGMYGAGAAVWIREVRVSAAATLQELQAQAVATASALQVTDATVTQHGKDIAAVVARTSVLEAKAPADGGRAASEARATQVEQTAAAAAAANAARLATLEARSPAGNGKFATAADVIAAQQAAAAENAATAQRVDALSVNIGPVVEWRIVNHRGASPSAAGSPVTARVQKAGGGANTTLRRGLNLLRFSDDGQSVTATAFDTYLVPPRQALADALNALTPSDYFVLASQDNHGAKLPALVEAIEAAGGANYRDTTNPMPYILVGRGALGKGNGIEITGPDVAPGGYLDYALTLINGVPKGIGEGGALTRQAAGTATALAATDVKVEQQGGQITALGSRTSALEVKVPADGGRAASEARVTAAEQAAATANAATATRLDAVRAAFTAGDNLVPADLGDTATTEDGVSLVTSTAQWSPNTRSFDVTPGEILDFAAEVRANEAMSRISLGVRFDGPAGSGVSNVTRRVDLSNPTVGTWYPLAMSHAVPAGATRAAVRVEAGGAVSKSLRRPRAVRRTAADLANAAAVVDAVQAAATANSATASRVQAVEAQLPAGGGRAASEASVTQLQTVVTTQGEQLAQQITTVDTKAGSAQTTATQALVAAGDAASAILSVRNQSSVDNLFPNAEFRAVANANRPSNMDIGYAVGRSVVALYMAGHEDTGVPVGKRAFIVVSNVSTNGSPMIVGLVKGGAPEFIAVEPNTEYIFSYYGSGAENMAARATTFTASGGSISDIDSSFVSAGGGNSLSAYARPFVRFTTPANCRWVRPQFYTIAAQSSGQVFSRFTAPQFERTKPGQTEPSPWAPGAAGLSEVTQELRAGLDAKYGVYVTNEGLISGFESVNDGVRPEFNVLASVLRIIAPGGGARTEFSDGNHRVYDAQGRLRVRMGVW